ncbi:MAG: HD domain-containing phosphohydrolase [Planctomycetota bacterium]|jgi:response regulator RpfG family c-di-GMP phosphodiesterase/pSer/pThr/pTyr-binding forkhead associated (FHA) protein
MPRVRVKNGPIKGQCFDIEEDPLTTGRDADCSIQILDKGASRKHAELFRIGEMCFIRDLSSRNGTFVNDNKVDEELLREGDRIQIGATILIFEGIGEDSNDLGLEFSAEGEESFGQTMTLRLEDLSTFNVSDDSDGSEAIRLRCIYRLSRILSELREQDELVEKALEFCCDQINADSGYLFVPDPQKGNIVPVGSFNSGNGKGSKISRSIIRRALHEKRAILTSDAMQDSRFSARESIVMKQIHSVICAPLSASGEFPGVLYMASHQVQEVFNEEELELVAAMGEMIGLALENCRILREQRDSFLNTIRVLVRANEMRDPTTRGRSDRIAIYAAGIAAQLHLPEEQSNNIQLAALLHNVGSLIVDGDSLFGVGRESSSNLPTEGKRLKATLELVGDMDCSQETLDAIQHMYEKFDGSGRNGLKGIDIPMAARVLTVANEFEVRANKVDEQRAEDALRDALVGMNREAGRWFDPAVVKALLVAHRSGKLYVRSTAVTEENVVSDPREQEPEPEA